MTIKNQTMKFTIHTKEAKVNIEITPEEIVNGLQQLLHTIERLDSGEK